jgi:cell division septum initiation protein DivIVA
MDILHLVDRLEELFNASRPIPLTHSVIVDEDKFLDIIDQMRISIPEEVKKAQQVNAQKERLLAQAQEESGRTVQAAREKAELLVDKESLVVDAQRRAAQIIERARLEADDIRAGADQYALDGLAGIETELNRLLNQVRNGIEVLQQKLPPAVDPAKPEEK